jgi:replicative DNA helicase
MKQTFDEIQIAQANGGVLGLPTGFVDLDRIISGLKPAELTIIAGRPGMGKSSFLQNIISHLTIKEKMTVLLFSPEMSAISIVRRMLASKSSVSYKDIETGNISEVDWGRVTISAGIIAEAKLFIDETSGVKLSKMIAEANRIKAEHGLDLMALDYLQLSRCPGHKERRHEIDAIAEGLHEIAKSLGIPVIGVSQLSRGPENRPGNRPMLSDLRDSGGIEQVADNVLFPFRAGYYESHIPMTVADVTVAKQRNGPTGRVDLYFEQKYMQFRNSERRHADREPGQEG